MTDRFVVTGCGRSGTTYLANLLTAAGVPCGHEEAYSWAGPGRWRDGRLAESSWLAAAQLDAVDVPVVLLVRHPLAVVRSLISIGYFGSAHQGDPTHRVLRQFAPGIYERWATPANRALAMWWALTEAALGRAELVLRLEQLDTDRLARLLRWAGHDPAPAAAAYARVGRANQSRPRQVDQLRWETHDPVLATRARGLAHALGYDPTLVLT
jgi:hypothetical protein